MHQAPRDCDIVLRHAAALKKLCERRKVRQGRLTLSNCRARAAWPYRYKRSLQRSKRGSRPLESANGAAAAVSAITAKAKLAGLWREKAEQTNSGPVIVEVNWPNVTAIVYGWSAEVGVILKALPRICPVLTQRRPLVSCRDWRPVFERLTAKKALPDSPRAMQAIAGLQTGRNRKVRERLRHGVGALWTPRIA
jgi:hypothetical protein